MQMRRINAELAPQPASAYSQAIEVSASTRTLFISGQLGTETDGTTPPGIEEQARLAWRNLGFQLEAAGMTFDNLVKVFGFDTVRYRGIAKNHHRLGANFALINLYLHRKHLAGTAA